MGHAVTAWPLCRVGCKRQASHWSAPRLSALSGHWARVCQEVVVGSAGAGKSVLLSSWTAARDGGVTSWLSCDEADADPVRFWTAFIEAPRAVAPGFGADAAELLAMDGAMSADVTASIANDAAKLTCWVSDRR
jgi:ATP/maltotriose-dependent transcriptional regulator MalT